VDDHVKRVCQNCASRPEREPDAGQGPPGLDPMTRRSFYQRELPPSLVGFASTQGKARFLEAAASGTAEGAADAPAPPSFARRSGGARVSARPPARLPPAQATSRWPSSSSRRASPPSAVPRVWPWC
jgi:hypothetical protein